MLHMHSVYRYTALLSAMLHCQFVLAVLVSDDTCNECSAISVLGEQISAFFLQD